MWSSNRLERMIVDVNKQISKYLSGLAEEVKQIGYGEFVKPPVLKVGGVDYSEVYMPDDGRALDGSMHRAKLQLVKAETDF